jgi:hypothetical protein
MNMKFLRLGGRTTVLERKQAFSIWLGQYKMLHIQQVQFPGPAKLCYHHVKEIKNETTELIRIRN